MRPRAIFSFSARGARPDLQDHVLADPKRGIFVIADGFGGAGEEAAKQACEAIQKFLFKEAGDEEATLPFVLKSYFSLAGNILFNALVHANQKLKYLNQGKTAFDRGGASVLAGFIDGDLLAIANVGCCSAWLVRGGSSRELVIPRSYSRLQDPMSADPRPGEDVPLMALGVSDDLEPEIFEYKLCNQDWIIFHTDGFLQNAREKLLNLRQSSEGAYDPEQMVLEAKQAVGSENFCENAALIWAAF